MALFFHSDKVDEFIPFPEAVAIAESALRGLKTSAAVNAPRKRLNLHLKIAEGSRHRVEHLRGWLGSLRCDSLGDIRNGCEF